MAYSEEVGKGVLWVNIICFFGIYRIFVVVAPKKYVM